MQPLLDAPPPVHPYAAGDVGAARRGPARRDGRGWHAPVGRIDVMSALRRHRHRHRRRRRHAGPPAGAVGQADPPARARRLAAARAAELAGARRLRRQPLRLGGHLVRRARPGRSSRRSTTSSAARPSSTAPRSTGCGPRTSASCATTTASRRRGRSAMTSWSPTTRGRAALPGPRRARGGPDGAAGQRAVPVPRRQPRAAHPAAPDDLAAAGHHPFHAPVRRHAATSATWRTAPACAAALRRVPCLVHAKSDAEVLAVRPALEHPNVTL